MRPLKTEEAKPRNQSPGGMKIRPRVN